MDLLWDTLGFAAKGFIVFVTATLTVAVVVALVRRSRGARSGSGSLEVFPLNKRYEAMTDGLRSAVLGRKAFRALMKSRKKVEPGPDASKPNVYVVDFEGDLMASGVAGLREEINALTAVAGPNDEVVVRLESPGGGVAQYGLAAAQLARLRERKIKLTVCIDKVAASGGYMMACVADTIVSAPFAIIGSIGVVAQVPNLHRLLKKHDVDFEEMTAGEYKRTVTVFGEITQKGRVKFQEQLEETHTLFKDFVKAQRPKLDLEKVATGEYWLGRRGLELGLVDQLGTSDDYVISRLKDANVFRLKFRESGTLRNRLSRFAADALDRSVLTLLSRLKSLEHV